MATVIDGKEVAREVRDRVADGVARFSAVQGRAPVLAAVIVGDDAASRIYVSRKEKACREIGIGSVGHELQADASEEELLELVDRLNRDPEISGILVQLPLPTQIDQGAVLAAIDPLKDVDGLTPVNAGLLALGRPGMRPCTPAGVIELLRSAGTELEGAESVIVGRSQLVGRPLALMLLERHATVTICHSRTRDLAAACRRADVLVAAAGRPKLIGAEMVKPGATVIDVGTNRLADGLVGDVDFDAVKEAAGAITPVPGGVGPMTIAMLLQNTLLAAERQAAA